jgi:hypothetical protein
VYESGAHRYTERMIERRITGWKQECRVIADNLKPILSKTKLITNLDQHFNHIPFFGSSSVSVEEEEEGFSRTALAANDNGNGEEQKISLRDELTSAPLSVNGDISLDLDQKTLIPSSAEMNHLESSENEEEHFPSSMESSSIPIKTAMEYLPSVLELSPYDTLISKLHQPQKIIVTDEMNSKTSETITILGPKSYEDEGRIETIRMRVRKDEEERENYLRDHPVVYDPSTSEYFFTMDHFVTRQERKEMLISHIRERKELNML